MYSQTLMRAGLRIRLLTGLLLVALVGANSGAATMCAACCGQVGLAGRSTKQFILQIPLPPHTPSYRASGSENIHSHHHCGNPPGIHCVIGPSGFGIRFDQRLDCARPAPFQVLREGPFRFDAPRGNVPIEVRGGAVGAHGVEKSAKDFVPFGGSPPIGIFDPASTPLRI